MNSKAKGFTLIELLVVISIIGFLSSIILVSLNSVRDKATRTAILQFDASTYHAIGAYALGTWNFNENTGIVAADTSGNGKNGTIFNGTWTTGVLGSALSFNGATTYVDTGIIDIPSNEISASAWVYSSFFAQNGFVIGKNPVNSKWQLFFSAGKLTWRTVSGLDLTCPAPSNNAWHHIAVSQRANQANLYIDGKICNTTNSMVMFATDNTNTVDIGRFTGGFYYSGLIDEVKLYSSALFASDIQNIYAEGLPRHLLADK